MNAQAQRWTADRKHQVLSAIRSRSLTRAQAMAAHGISEEELSSWECRLDRHGPAGLKQTRLQVLR